MKKFWIALSLGLLVTACKSGELKPIQQQQVGDYTVIVLSESGTAKNGANDFTLEFRKTADNQLVDVGPVEVSPIMEMQGMPPMIGSSTVMPGDKPGQYHVKATLAMAGLWKFNVRFGDQSVRINLNAE
jgi:YtkA-like